MNELQIFKNPEFGTVRTLEEGGVVLFCGKDIAGALGYKIPKDAISLHCKGAVKRRIPTAGGEQEMSFIPESDLYRLIFSSKLPTAEKFTDWVTSEVLPTIRKHGAYMTPETLQEAILNPDMMIQLCQQLKAEQDKNAALKVVNSRLTVDNQIMQPKADYFDELVERNLNTGIRETAKLLGIGQKEFVAFLQDKKYLYRDKRGRLMPYMDKNNGLFEVKECFNNKTNWAGTQVLITPKGRETFRLLYLQGKKVK